MAVNCFENCYFTYNIGRGMSKTIILKNVIFSAVFLSAAYMGLKENLIALPILQILLSSLFMNELIHHLNFVAKLNILLRLINDFERKMYEKHPHFFSYSNDRIPFYLLIR